MANLSFSSTNNQKNKKKHQARAANHPAARSATRSATRPATQPIARSDGLLFSRSFNRFSNRPTSHSARKKGGQLGSIEPDFFSSLEKQAQLQAKLKANQVLPKNSEGLVALVGRYPWQFLLITSGLTAILIRWSSWLVVLKGLIGQELGG
ncbi:MAG: hypothetical protein GF381_03550 [Candidatus Pacebacteria bacterium]|nr:hypothetical protein [Candidatus Paceibacterota bacterium]